MKNCISSGKMTAYLDHQLPPEEQQAVTHHMEKCTGCRRQLAELKQQNEFVGEKISGYKTILDSMEVDRDNSWQSFQSLLANHKQKKGVLHMNGLKRYMAGAAAAAVLVGVLSIVPSTGSFASQFLSIFRMDRVEVVEFDDESLRDLHNQMQNQEGFDKMFEINHGQYAAAYEVEPGDVKAETGFSPLIPQQLGAYRLDKLEVQPGNTMTAKPNVDEINQYLVQLGTDKLLSREADGSEITVNTSDTVIASYGQEIKVMQTPAPEFKVSGAMEIDELRGIMLNNPAVPEEIRAAVSSVEDWQRTLLIPDVDGSSREVQVNGTTGVFINPSEDSEHLPAGSQSALIWPQADLWFAISGPLTLEEALDLAENLR